MKPTYYHIRPISIHWLIVGWRLHLNPLSSFIGGFGTCERELSAVTTTLAGDIPAGITGGSGGFVDVPFIWRFHDAVGVLAFYWGHPMAFRASSYMLLIWPVRGFIKIFFNGPSRVLLHEMRVLDNLEPETPLSFSEWQGICRWYFPMRWTLTIQKVDRHFKSCGGGPLSKSRGAIIP